MSKHLGRLFRTCEKRPMIWSRKEAIEKAERKRLAEKRAEIRLTKRWRQVFAWCPVYTIQDSWVWLEYVDRIGVYKYPTRKQGLYWEYSERK